MFATIRLSFIYAKGTNMFREAIGELAQYEDWQLRKIVAELAGVGAWVQAELQERAKVQKSYFTRKERQAQIIRVLGDGETLSTSQIAKSLGMSASQHLRNMLCELYASGKIVGYAQTQNLKNPMYYWYVQKTVPMQFPELAGIPDCENQ